MILITCIIILLYLSFVISIVLIIEKKRFDKRIEVNEYIKNQDYSNFKGLIREDFSFYSNGNKLNGYTFYYEKNNNKKVIFVNGYHTTTETYIVEINYLASLGYIVYCYDNTGIGKSEGKSMKGTPQSMIDLQNCIDHLRKENPNENLILVGHSMGANAAINILNNNEIDKVIAISPYNHITDVVCDNIKKMVGRNIFLFKFLHKIYLRIKFKKIASFQAYETLKYTNTKVLVIHGVEDKTVKVDNCINACTFNTNMFVDFLILDNKGHRPLLSQNAINYNMYLKHQVDELKMNYGKNIPQTEVEAINKKVNFEIKDELDEKVLQKIKTFLKEEQL